MEKLKFRRQYLLTPAEYEELKEWQTEKIGSHFLYVHPECKLEKASGKNDLYLVGFFLDPHDSGKKSKDILIDIAREGNIEKYPELLYSLVGRFVLIIKQNNDFIFFNDACGLKTLYYSTNGNNVYAASQPLLLAKVLKIDRTKAYDEYFNSEYVKKNIEHWIPSGLSFYENVFHLVPNHYVRASEKSQIRFYPNKNLPEGEYNDLLNKFSSLLKSIVTTAYNHLDLAFSLTAGWDSRIILSCCKDLREYIMFYTLRYRDYGDKHMDIKIPALLSELLKLKYEVFDCQKGMSEEFSVLYKQNTDMAHLNDWGKIAYGILKTYPQDKVAVKGSCSEIGRCFYYPNCKHKKNLTENDIVQLERGWSELDFIKEHIKIWFNDKKENNYGYDILDLFYWEHRMGSWQAQSQLEWDVVQETFTPFNSRELLDLMLAVNPTYRKTDNPALYRDTMKILWQDVLFVPINPIPLKKRLRKIIVGLFKPIAMILSFDFKSL
ncbi:MAG: hypothetical protein GX876_05875 [Bacteroidales bacterium]|nr:hypothetical protein [Bacteroidales bacterium]